VEFAESLGERVAVALSVALVEVTDPLGGSLETA